MRISDWSSDVCSSDLAAPVDLDAVPDGNSDGKLRRIRGTVTKVLRAAGSDNWGIVKVALSDKSVVTLRGTFLGEVKPSFGETVDCAAEREIGRASCRERGCQYV